MMLDTEALPWAGIPIMVNRHLRPCRFEDGYFFMAEPRPMLVFAFGYAAWRFAYVLTTRYDR